MYIWTSSKMKKKLVSIMKALKIPICQILIGTHRRKKVRFALSHRRKAPLMKGKICRYIIRKRDFTRTNKK